MKISVKVRGGGLLGELVLSHSLLLLTFCACCLRTPQNQVCHTLTSFEWSLWNIEYCECTRALKTDITRRGVLTYSSLPPHAPQQSSIAIVVFTNGIEKSAPPKSALPPLPCNPWASATPEPHGSRLHGVYIAHHFGLLGSDHEDIGGWHDTGR